MNGITRPSVPQAARRWIPVLTVLLLCGCETITRHHQVNVNRQVSQDLVRSLAVLEFNWKPPDIQVQPGITVGHLEDCGAVVADIVTNELMSLDRYAIRERAELKSVLSEHHLELSELMAKGEYRRIGKLAGIDGLVIGNVASANMAFVLPNTRVGFSFNCRCVNTETGDVMWSIGGDIHIDYASSADPSHWARILIRELVDQLEQKLEAAEAG